MRLARPCSAKQVEFEKLPLASSIAFLMRRVVVPSLGGKGSPATTAFIVTFGSAKSEHAV